MPLNNLVWSQSGGGLSTHAWTTAERTGAAWVGNDAAAHVTLLRNTVEEELAVGMEQRGVPREQMLDRVRHALQQWGLEQQAQQDPTTLSTGQTRRLAIAAALLTAPSSLVLDCPLDGLDTAAAHTLREVLERFEGDVTVYDRVASLISDATAKHHQLLNHNELVEAQVPPVPLPSRRTPQPGAEHLVMQDVQVSYASTTIGPINLEAKGGWVTHLAGPNGSGKTTAFLAAMGLVPYRGRVETGTMGWAPTAMDQAVTQRTVARELAVGASRDHAEVVLRWMGLERWAETHPLDVPSSVRRLVLVAAAMVRGPQTLLLDEPTVGLDGEGYRWLAEAMHRYAAGEYHLALAQHGLEVGDVETPAVLWTCHDANFAGAVSDCATVCGE